jgi:hypothetical protein
LSDNCSSRHKLSALIVLLTICRGEKCQPYPCTASFSAPPHVVALQVAFERQILKPVFHLIGYRLWV